METKNIEVRLEVIKLLTTIGDKEGIALQADALKSAQDSTIDEIISLLESSNYRQALYLIKKYKSEHFSTSTIDLEEESERVLGVEDMLRMSPLAKETLNQYRSQAYTQDDLAKFSQSIEANNDNKQETLKEEVIKQEPPRAVPQKQATKEEVTQEEEMHTLIENANQDVPLDEISANVLGKKEKKTRSKVFSKYKTLREKFARKEKKEVTEIKNEIEDTTEEVKKELEVNIQEKQSNKELETQAVKEETKVETTSKVTEKDQQPSATESENKATEKKPEQEKQEQVQEESIFPPIPHIEEKFRQNFIHYPPVKESDVWVEVVIKFLKNIAKNSYTQQDVANFLDEFDYFLNKKDIAKAAQVILLAGATDSKYAKFRLARELFSGQILKRNIKASFEIIKALASDFYPEAVCDLAQFYEYGLGVPKDKKVAMRLYEKAFELGSVRASKHINRLKESGGLLSSLLKLK